jgi:hypothetical protein
VRNFAHGDAASTSEEGTFRELPAGVTGWVGALSITAVLVLMGFIAKLSVQQFLGIEIGSWTVQDLCLFAGRWATDTLTVTLEQLFAHPFTLGLPLLAFLLPTILLAVIPEDHSAARPLTFLSMGLSVIGLAAVIYWCEMPTVKMNDWLTTSLGKQVPDDLAPQTRLSELRLTRLVSAMDAVAENGRTICTEPKLHSTKADPPALKRYLRGNTPATDALNYLKTMYACTVLVCIGVWLSLYLHAPVEEPRLVDEIFRGLRLVMLLAMLPIASCFIPYIYGKLIYSTSLPLVTVFFTKDNGKTVSSAEEAARKTTTPGDAQERDSQPENNQFLLVDVQDKEIALIAISDDPPALQRWPRERIDHIVQFGNSDPFNQILLQCNWLPPKTDMVKPQP